MKPATARVIRKLLNLSEIVSDAPSNWGGWQGGFPGGNGSALKGLKGGTTRKPIRRKKHEPEIDGVRKTSAGGWKGTFRLSGKKTGIIFAPTLAQSANKVDVKNPTISPTDMPPKKGRTDRQVREQRLSQQVVQRYASLHEKDVLGSLIATGVKHLLKHAFGKSKPVKSLRSHGTGTGWNSTKPVTKPPTQTQTKPSSTTNNTMAKWNAKWGSNKDHDAALKAADTPEKWHNHLQSKLPADQRKPYIAEPPKESPAAPESKPRIRVQAGRRKIMSDPDRKKMDAHSEKKFNPDPATKIKKPKSLKRSQPLSRAIKNDFYDDPLDDILTKEALAFQRKFLRTECANSLFSRRT